MSFAAIGISLGTAAATAAGAGATTAAVAGIAGGVAGSALGGAFAGKSADSQINVPGFRPFTGFQATPDNLGEAAQVDVAGVTARTAEQNRTVGFPLAKQAAAGFNDAAFAQILSQLGELFGSEQEFAALRGQITDSIEAQLRGEISRGTRQQIGRSVLNSNLTELGGSAVDFASAGRCHRAECTAGRRVA